MPPDTKATRGNERPVRLRAKDGDGVSTPGRHVDAAVARDLHGVRIMIRREPLHHLAGGDVDDGQAVADVFGDVDEARARCRGDAGGISRARLVRHLLSEHDPRAQFRRLAVPGVTVDGVVVAAGYVEHLSVGRERRAEKRSRLRDRLRDPQRLQIDDLDSLLAPAAEHHDQLLSARRGHHSHRHAPQIEHGAFGVEPLSGRQQRRRGKEQQHGRERHFRRRLAISFPSSSAV